jgi:hypothetical protein
VIIGTTQPARSHSPVWVVPGTTASRAAGSPRTSPLMPPPRHHLVWVRASGHLGMEAIGAERHGQADQLAYLGRMPEG